MVVSSVIPCASVAVLLTYLSELGQQQQQRLPHSVFDTMLQGVAIVTHF